MRRIRVCYLFVTMYKIRTDINRKPHITRHRPFSKKFTTIYKFTTTEKYMNHTNHTLSNLITNWMNVADV